MNFDAKIVNKALRTEMFGILKETGFTRRKGQKLWRCHDFFVDMTEFRHFNRYTADVIGTETFSVTIELGVFLPDMVNGNDNNRDTLFPDLSDCHFRGHMIKHLLQPELERRDIWHVSQDGSNLEAVITDIRNVVEKDAPRWFDRVHDLDTMRTRLEGDCTETTADGRIGLLHGFGTLGSPKRQKVMAAVDEVLARMKTL